MDLDKNKLYHIMFLPTALKDFHLDDLLSYLFFVVLFVAIYLWHVRHDHGHQREMIQKLDEMNKLLKKMLKKLG